MKIQRFEELECWKEARQLVNMVYEAVKDNMNFQKDFRLNSQITAAAVSTMSNIAGSAPQVITVNLCCLWNREFVNKTSLYWAHRRFEQTVVL